MFNDFSFLITKGNFQRNILCQNKNKRTNSKLKCKIFSDSNIVLILYFEEALIAFL